MAHITVQGLLYANGKLVSQDVITTQFIAQIVDALQSDTAVLHLYKYHQTGTGTTVATATDTAIETAIEGGARTAGTQTEPGGSTNTYRSVGSIMYADAHLITEWGLFDAATDGNLLDRAVFSPVSVSASETVAWTFDLVFTAS